MAATSSSSIATEDYPQCKRSKAVSNGITLLLFRCCDLRLHDNRALVAAVASGPVVPVFLWSRSEDGHRWGIRGASEVYLKQAIVALEARLVVLGSKLIFRLCGSGQERKLAATDAPCSPTVTPSSSPFASELLALILETGATSVHYTVEHTPEARARDAAMEAALRSSPHTTGVSLTAHSSSQLLHSPESVALSGGFHGGHWGTLMPFLRACEKTGPVPRCLPVPAPGSLAPPEQWPVSCGVAGLGLAVMPSCQKTQNNEKKKTMMNHAREDHRGPVKESFQEEQALPVAVVDWAAPLRAAWPAGEVVAMAACERFVATGMLRYEKERSRADLFDGSGNASLSTSRLSVAMRFGELSPRFLYWAVQDAKLPKEVTKTFARRLHWRDLAYFQLACFPDMRTVGIRKHYDATQWCEPRAEYDRRLRAWQRGETGYPIVDAGMRELFHSGWMTQAVRMVCASFLVESLRVSWVDGAEWFADTLCDADPAINAMMWQNAGRCGVDQWNFAPSPESGSQDPTGRYVRRFVPELAALPTKYLHRPWEAPQAVLQAAGVGLGGTAQAASAAAAVASTSYPSRVVSDLASEHALSVKAVLAMRRAHQQHNDAKGYDIIALPAATGAAAGSGPCPTTTVFTKEEYRVGRDGAVLPPPPRNTRRPLSGNGRGGGTSKSKAGRGSSKDKGKKMPMSTGVR